MHFAILRHHSLQTELFRAFVRDRHTDQTAPVRCHEIDCLGRHLFRRDDEVALIFAVGVVGHDDDASARDIAHHIVNRIELKCLCRLRNHCRNNNLMVGRDSVEPTSNLYSCCCSSSKSCSYSNPNSRLINSSARSEPEWHLSLAPPNLTPRSLPGDTCRDCSPETRLSASL